MFYFDQVVHTSRVLLQKLKQNIQHSELLKCKYLCVQWENSKLTKVQRTLSGYCPLGFGTLLDNVARRGLFDISPENKAMYTIILSITTTMLLIVHLLGNGILHETIKFRFNISQPVPITLNYAMYIDNFGFSQAVSE